jgi:predicted ATPase
VPAFTSARNTSRVSVKRNGEDAVKRALETVEMYPVASTTRSTALDE